MKLHLLPPITLLPAPHDRADDEQIIEDWARGLDWVKWLLGSVRARVEVLLVEEPAEWDHFAQHLLREAVRARAQNCVAVRACQRSRWAHRRGCTALLPAST